MPNPNVANESYYSQNVKVPDGSETSDSDKSPIQNNTKNGEEVHDEKTLLQEGGADADVEDNKPEVDDDGLSPELNASRESGNKTEIDEDLLDVSHDRDHDEEAVGECEEKISDNSKKGRTERKKKLSDTEQETGNEKEAVAGTSAARKSKLSSEACEEIGGSASASTRKRSGLKSNSEADVVEPRKSSRRLNDKPEVAKPEEKQSKTKRRKKGEESSDDRASRLENLVLNEPIPSPEKVQFKKTKLSTVFEVTEHEASSRVERLSEQNVEKTETSSKEKEPGSTSQEAAIVDENIGPGSHQTEDNSVEPSPNDDNQAIVDRESSSRSHKVLEPSEDGNDDKLTSPDKVQRKKVAKRGRSRSIVQKSKVLEEGENESDEMGQNSEKVQENQVQQLTGQDPRTGDIQDFPESADEEVDGNTLPSPRIEEKIKESSAVELADHDFIPPTQAAPSTRSRGRKRKSEETATADSASKERAEMEKIQDSFSSGKRQRMAKKFDSEIWSTPERKSRSSTSSNSVSDIENSSPRKSSKSKNSPQSSKSGGTKTDKSQSTVTPTRGQAKIDKTKCPASVPADKFPSPKPGPSRTPKTPIRAQVDLRTPRVRSKLDLRTNARAISTPSRDETILRGNVTFFDKTGDLSSVLSPPSTKKKKRGESSATSDVTGESNCSFQ